ncbi:Oligosaccharide translocation protein rft1 [Lecanora helva]
MPASDKVSNQDSDKTLDKPNNVATRSALGAAFLVLNQIGSRALTFAINQLLFRLLSPGVYGVAAQLELGSVSILYFSRESLRVALQRQRTPEASEQSTKDENDHDGKAAKDVAEAYGPSRRLQEAVNLSHIAIALGLPLTLIFSWLYLNEADAAVLSTPQIQVSLYSYALATILELLNEPAYAIAQQQLLYGTRASAEFLASFNRCIVTSVLAFWAHRNQYSIGVLPFAMGQLSYAFTLNLIYTLKALPICTQNRVSLFPKSIAKNNTYLISCLSRPLLTIAATFYGQSLFKQFQTSGDGYLIATLAPLPSQGAYALATNYGSLLARVLFQPIEESSRSLFGRLLPPFPKTPQQNPTASDLQSLSRAKTHLTTTLHLYLLLALLATTLGPPLSPLLLHTLAGPHWSTTEAPLVLSSYCYLIPLLAINGILEAFVTAVATPAQVAKQNLWMMGFSVAFAATGWVVLRVLGMGAQGLVVTNAVVMGLRGWWSWGFVRGYFGGWGVREGVRVGGMMPRWGSLVVGGVGRWVLEVVVKGGEGAGLAGLVYGIAIAGVCGLAILGCEREFLLSILPDSVLERVPMLQGRGNRKGDGGAKKDE